MERQWPDAMEKQLRFRALYGMGDLGQVIEA